MPSLGALAALLGLPRFSPSRVALAFALLLVAAALTVAAVIELIEALRVALLTILHPAWVSLITGLVLLGIAAGACLVAHHLSQPLPPPRRPAGAPPAAPAGDPTLDAALRWIRQNPNQATVLAATLGFLAGAMPEARKTLAELLKPPH